MEQPSVVEYFGSEDEGNRCGYCKQADTSLTHGMWAHTLRCSDYLKLIDRGWRRSGKYLYKPTMDQTCCPQYTIRCDTTQTKLTKSQKKIVRRLNKFLISGERKSITDDNNVEDTAAGNNNAEWKVKVSSSKNLPSGINMKSISSDMDRTLSSSVLATRGVDSVSKEKESSNRQPTRVEDSVSKEKESSSRQPKNAAQQDNKTINTSYNQTQGKQRKAKEIRKERRLNKLMAKTEQSNSTFDLSLATASVAKTEKYPEKSIEQLVHDDLPSQLKHRLEVKLVQCCPASEDYERSFADEHRVFQKYQMAVHNDTLEDCAVQSFRRFLVDGPLQAEGVHGAYHQQYYLDGRLVAVGVLDILPTCVSSVYFFYDPDYSFLSLGTYSAIREIYFVRKLQKKHPQIKYYYMGFYIHSCQKMRYKARFSLSYLLCPQTYNWEEVETCLPKLDFSKYSRFNPDPKAEPVMTDVNKIQILCQRRIIAYKKYKSLLQDSATKKRKIKELEEYASLVGPAATSLLIYQDP